MIYTMYTTEQFIAKSKLIHGLKYDYSLSEYKGAFKKVKIICPIHGLFEQRASDHSNQGRGCPKCARESFKNNNWLKLANSIHNNKYDYSLVNYTNLMDKVKIICPIHGEFEQRMYCHIHKSQGCPKCPIGEISKPHQEIIDYIKSIYNGEIKINNKEIINPKEIDILIPDKKLAIEYNGLFWHSTNSINKDYRHKEKVEICEKNQLNLFNIWEHEWRNKKDIIKSMLTNKLGLSKRIYARKCSIKELSNTEYNLFISNNHLQGKTNSTYKIGLIYNEEIICVIGLNKHPKYEFEISRIATKKYTNATGGISKLLNYFINKIKPSKIMSYANRSHSNGKLYENLGFTHILNTKPGYFYTKYGLIYPRQKFQKHKLKKLKNFDPKLSEVKNMINNGYKRLFDCGHKKYILTIPQNHQ